MRSVRGGLVTPTPMELAVLYPSQPVNTTEQKPEQTNKQEEINKPLVEYIWKETYRATTKDDGYQISDTLKGASTLTLTSTFLGGEPACVGTYQEDYASYRSGFRAFYQRV